MKKTARNRQAGDWVGVALEKVPKDMLHRATMTDNQDRRGFWMLWGGESFP